jgi:hypothetical protein
MSAIDFKEIPEAHLATGEQDTFELFATDFLESMGYNIIERPSRGPDLGQDLQVQEQRQGVGGKTTIRWLVSCKHKAHTGRSVSLDDEENIVERVESKGCDGFLAFYSTLPSSSLAERIKKLTSRFETQVFDRARIERYLLAKNCADVASRYFPESFKRWKISHQRPANVFSQPEPLVCEVCGTNLLLPKPSGIFVLWQKYDGSSHHHEEFVDVHWCCKGNCDQVLERRMYNKHGSDILDTWEDIPDMCVPLVYLKRLMGLFNGFQDKDKWSPDAFKKLKTLLVAIYPHIVRDASPDEMERIQELSSIPSYLGGLGN